MGNVNHNQQIVTPLLWKGNTDPHIQVYVRTCMHTHTQEYAEKPELEESAVSFPVDALDWMELLVIQSCHPEILQAPDADDPVSYHFVAFVHKDGDLYELGKSYYVQIQLMSWKMFAL